MKKLWPYLASFRKESILAPLLKLSEALMDLLVPLVVAVIINRGVSENDGGVILRYFLLLIGLALLGMVLSFTAQWLSAKASVGFATRIRQALFDRIQTLSYRDLDRLGANTLITRMTSDINQIQNGLNLALRLLLRSPFIVFGALVMSFTIDIRSALIFAAAIPLLSVVVFGIMLGSIPMYSRVQGLLDRLLGITRENLTGVRVIRAFRKEKDEVSAFDRENEQLTRMNERVGRLSALMNPATWLIVNIAAILLIRLGGFQVNDGVLLQGDVVALYNYMAMIIVELVKLASLIITINKALACGKRVSAMLDITPAMTWPEESPDPIPVSDTAVRFDHVSFSYSAGSDPALTDIDFTAHRGETIGIIGGTGSGKTTLVQLIARFYDVSEGRVLVDGLDVRQYSEKALIGKIGIVPQKAVLFEGSVRDNLLWGREDATDEEMWAALETAQAAEIVRGKEGGLDARVEQGGQNLSGGQRQRLTIARALVRNPEILILDDSASALDFATDYALRRALSALPDTMTVLIVSQRAASVRDADRILVLDDGRLAGNGTHAELMAGCAVYREIYHSQFPEDRSDVVPASGKEAMA